MTDENNSKLGFGEVALCLSGGGYRAATFHLGALHMLDELNLIDNAKYLSTASGGTIVAMKYVVDRIAGKSFSDTYADFRDFLLGCNVVQEAFDGLGASPSPAGGNDLSLIRSAAEVYRRRLGVKGTLQDLTDDIVSKGTFRDLIFNATEFRSGNGFRFRAAGKRVIVGNQVVTVRDEVKGQIELADIVAASSCFPGAFEPIRFPEDFVLADRSTACKPFSGEGREVTTVALMDGGIFDNQGLHGMVRTYNREPLPFDFVLISDTTQRNEELLSYSIEKRKAGVPIKYVTIVLVTALMVLLVGSGFLAWRVVTGWSATAMAQSLLLAFVAAFSLLFSTTLLILLGWGFSKIRKLSVSGADFPIWKYIKNLCYSDLKTLLLTRLFSAKAMTFNVFMKRIRAQTMETALSAVDSESRKNLLHGKHVFSLIYDLDSKTARPQLYKDDPDLIPTNTMVETSIRAGKAPTALWISENDFRDLVACGRITTCFSLMELIWGRWRKNDSEAIKGGRRSEPCPIDPGSPFHSDYCALKAKWQDLKQEFP